MPVAAYNKFNSFTTKLGLKLIDLDADVLKVYLTNTLPVTTNTIFGTPAEIAAGNGYIAGGTDAQAVWSETPAGTGNLTTTDITWTATGGSIATFRYAVLYDDTSVSKWLIAWFDYGSSITPAVGESFVVDFGTITFTIV